MGLGKWKVWNLRKPQQTQVNDYMLEIGTHSHLKTSIHNNRFLLPPELSKLNFAQINHYLSTNPLTDLH